MLISTFFFFVIFIIYKISFLFLMAKKKNYLKNEDLKEEILKCIDAGFEKAISLGFIPDVQTFDSDEPEEIEIYENAIRLGYVPERSNWIKKIREYDPEKVKTLITNGEITQEEFNILDKQMEKPIVSPTLGEMFNLIVENVSRSFYWANPDDGEDCKANALLDLCSSFWKFEPVDSNGKAYNAFAFCTQIAYFGIAGAHRILHPKKYNGTISLSCLDENGKPFDFYNI